MKKLTRNIVIVVIGLVFAAITFINGSTLSQNSEFSFSSYNLLDENELLTSAMKQANGVVDIVDVTEEVTRLVPLGEWLYLGGMTPVSTEGNPGQPVFVLAMQGVFRWGDSDDPSTLPTTETFTVAIDAVSGRIISYTGMFMDPRSIVDLSITFPAPVTLEISPIYQESTQEVTPIMLPSPVSTLSVDNSIPLPPAP